MRVIKWPRSDSDGSCMNKNVRDNEGLSFTVVNFVLLGSDSFKVYAINPTPRSPSLIRGNYHKGLALPMLRQISFKA